MSPEHVLLSDRIAKGNIHLILLMRERAAERCTVFGEAQRHQGTWLPPLWDILCIPWSTLVLPALKT